MKEAAGHNGQGRDGCGGRHAGGAVRGGRCGAPAGGRFRRAARAGGAVVEGELEHLRHVERAATDPRLLDLRLARKPVGDDQRLSPGPAQRRQQRVLADCIDSS